MAYAGFGKLSRLIDVKFYLALKKLIDYDFRSNIDKIENPYGDGGASEKALTVIEMCDVKKRKNNFHDLPADHRHISG